MGTMTKSGTTQPAYPRSLPRRLGLLDATTIVAGSMIGSGIFITSADISRQVRSGSLLLLVWVFTALVTVAGAWSYGKLAMAFPRAGGQYVYLREAWGDLGGFLYGWAVLLVIQTGTIAAVAVAFAKYLGVLIPAISSKHVFFKARFLSVTPLELVAIALILLLTWWNTTSVENGARLQNVFTTAKVLSLVGLLAVCFTAGSGLATTSWALPAASDLRLPLIWAFAVATVGSLFSADAWNNVTFLGEEVRDAERNVPRALVYGTGLVTTLYVLANVGYLNALPLSGIASRSRGPRRDGRDRRRDRQRRIGHAGSHHGRRHPRLDVRLPERPDPLGLARPLRDVAGRPLLQVPLPRSFRRRSSP